MAIKFDKEMLLKHRFWVMLAASVLMTLVGIFILEFSEAAGRDDMKKALASVKNLPVKDSPKTIEEIKKNADLARKNEAGVWKNAYDPQASLFTWPKPVEDKYDFANGYFANDIKIMKLPDSGPKPAPKVNPKKGAEPEKAAVEERNYPPDTPNLMHGAFVRQQEDWFEITDRKGEVRKFFQTKRSERILTEDAKAVGFHEMNKFAAKKMLAVGYQRGMYFNDPLIINASHTFQKSYSDQILPILESVDPYVDPANGVVQLKNWLFTKDSLPHETVPDQRFIRYVTKPWPLGNVNVSQEAWIAQEDLWIQKEIYRMIRSANDTVSNFTLDATAKNDERNKKFHNSYFDLELKLDEKENLFFKITNALPRKQSVDLSFRVLLNSAKGHKEEIIKISGFPLAPKGTKDTGATDRDYLTKTIARGKEERTGIYSVQQVLNWQTAAVKRIDHISIGNNDTGDMSHSQRTITVGLRPLEGEAGKVAAGTPGKGGPMPGPKGPKAPPAGKKPPAGQAAQAGKGAAAIAAGNKGPLPLVDLWTDRYVEVSEQARRLPVAVVLIVDQEHVDRVLTAFNNSKLRFLETQVLLNQYAGSLQPPAVEDKAEPALVPPIGFRPFGRGSGPAPGPGPGRPPEQPAGGADLETNMELVIYGIVTLYQRFPPRPPMAPLDKGP